MNSLPPTAPDFQTQSLPHPIGYYVAPTQLGFVDRRTRLTVFGVLFILAGALTGLMTLAMPVTLFITPQTPAMQQPVYSVVLTTAVYAALTAALVWLAIGCFLRRRWTRPIVLSLGVIAVTIGAISMVVLAMISSSMADLIRASIASVPTPAGAAPNPVPGDFFIYIIVGFTLAFTAVIYVFVPLIITVCFWPVSVKQTLEHFDPHPRWTDGVPTPVLGLALKLWIIAASSLLILAYTAISVGGTIIKAPALIATALASAAFFAYVGLLVYRQRMLGWALMLVSSLGLCGLIILSSLQADWGQSLRELKMPESQRALITPMIDSFATAGVATGVLCALAVILFAMRQKHYFDR